MTPQSKPITPLTLWTQHPMSKGGKMAGMWSWGNTSPLNNAFCTHECSFGKHCYAKRYCMIRPNVNKAYVRNGDILSKTALLTNAPETLWAPPGSHRIQSFGEILNFTHLANIVALCEACEHSHFTIWTKRWTMFNEVNVPKNLTIIASQEMGVTEKVPGYPTFIVSKEPPKGHYFECQGKCVSCGYCYRGWHGGGLNPEIAIWELPK